MKKYAKAAAMLLALLMLAAGLVGCREKTSSANVMITSSYVFLDQYDQYGASLREKLPEYNTGDTEIKFLSYSSSGVTAMGGSKLDAMLATSEVDLLICDMATAIKYGENGDMYENLEDVFTPEEIEGMKYKLVSLPKIDDDGVPTGEETALVAVDISGHTIIKDMVMEEDIYLLIPSTAFDKEAGRDIIKVIAAE